MKIPAEEFPDINFVGLIIGQNAATLRGIEKEVHDIDLLNSSIHLFAVWRQGRASWQG